MSRCILCFEICRYRIKFFVLRVRSIWNINFISTGFLCFVCLCIVMSYRPYRKIYIFFSVRYVIKVSRIFIRCLLMSVSCSNVVHVSPTCKTNKYCAG